MAHPEQPDSEAAAGTAGRRSLWLAFLLAVTFLFGGAGIRVWRVVDGEFDRIAEKNRTAAEREREARARHFDAFREDQEILAELHERLVRPGRERDAGPWFERLLGVEDTDAAWNRVVVGPGTLPELGENLREQLIGTDWRTIDPALVEHLDTTWMAEARNYDHWAFPQAQDATCPLLGFSPSTAVHRLVPWGKVRFLQGRTSEDRSAARGEIEQLARLAYSFDAFWGPVLSLSFLEHADRLDPEADPVAIETRYKRARRGDRAAVLAFGPRTVSRDMWNATRFGRCATLAHAGWNLGVVAAFDDDVSEPERFFLDALSASDCQLPWLRAAWRNPDTRRACANAFADALGDGTYVWPPNPVATRALHVVDSAPGLSWLAEEMAREQVTWRTMRAYEPPPPPSPPKSTTSSDPSRHRRRRAR